MKNLKDIITEKLKLDKNLIMYNYYPETRKELRKILLERLDKDKDADLNDIDVSKITDMGISENDVGLFEYLDPHNIKIDKWNVSNVKNMNQMFWYCRNLVIDISNWDVSKVKDMTDMFNGCKNFNCDLSKWKTNNLQIADGTFMNCQRFEGKGLGNWDMSSVKHIDSMFQGCNNLKEDFGKDLEHWQLNNNPTMINTFYRTLIKKPSWYKE